VPFPIPTGQAQSPFRPQYPTACMRLTTVNAQSRHSCTQAFLSILLNGSWRRMQRLSVSRRWICHCSCGEVFCFRIIPRSINSQRIRIAFSDKIRELSDVFTIYESNNIFILASHFYTIELNQSWSNVRLSILVENEAEVSLTFLRPRGYEKQFLHQFDKPDLGWSVEKRENLNGSIRPVRLVLVPVKVWICKTIHSSPVNLTHLTPKTCIENHHSTTILLLGRDNVATDCLRSDIYSWQ